MITSTISFPHTDALEALLKTEELTFKHKRATYTIARNDEIVVTISAEDATALKATMASICRVLAVHEKAHEKGS